MLTLQYPVAPSWSPVFFSTIIFTFLMSSLVFMKMSLNMFIIFSLLGLFWTLKLWYSELFRETKYKGLNNFFMQMCLKLGMVFFIVSELMFFFSFFWTYFHYMFMLLPDFFFGWPPFCFIPINYLSMPLLNTLILLFSGFTLTMSHNFMMEVSLKKTKFYTQFTILLGAVFTLCQGWEFYYLDFLFSDSSYGAIFYLGTGFHGCHVLFGTLAIFLVSILISNKYISVNSSLFEMVAWYWHFVDVIWLILFTEFYWWVNFY